MAYFKMEATPGEWDVIYEANLQAYSGGEGYYDDQYLIGRADLHVFILKDIGPEKVEGIGEAGWKRELFLAADDVSQTAGSLMSEVLESSFLSNEVFQNLQRIVIVDWIGIDKAYRGKGVGLKMMKEIQNFFSGNLVLLDPTPTPFRMPAIRQTVNVHSYGQEIGVNEEDEVEDMDEKEYAAAAKTAREKLCNYWSKCGFMRLLIVPTDFIFHHNKLAHSEESAKDES